MPIFIYRGRYNADAVKGMMTSPEDREAALAKVFEKAGGKLLAFYLTFGEDDFLTIADCPDHHAALALAIAGAAGGSISDMKRLAKTLRTRDADRATKLGFPACRRSQAVAGMKRSEIRERLASLNVSPGFR